MPVGRDDPGNFAVFYEDTAVLQSATSIEDSDVTDVIMNDARHEYNP